MSSSLSRRRFLQGVGGSIALPMLETFAPRAVVAADLAAASAPKRMAVLYFPNGALPEYWKPTTPGTDFELPRFLKPLAAHRSEMLVLGGLDCDKAYANGDGAGDHAR